MTQGPAMRNRPLERSTTMSGMEYIITVLRRPVLAGRTNEGCEERVRHQRLRLELRVELATQEPRMIRNFNDLDEVLVRRNTRNDQAVLGQNLLEPPIEFVAMPVALGNHRSVVDAVGERSLLEIGRVGAQTHGPADGVHAKQVAQLINDRVRCIRVELGAVGIPQSADILRILDDGALHPGTNPEIRDFFFAGVLDGADHSGNAALSESAGDENAVEFPKPGRFAAIFQARSEEHTSEL